VLLARNATIDLGNMTRKNGKRAAKKDIRVHGSIHWYNNASGISRCR